jgi:hypothetical protein
MPARELRLIKRFAEFRSRNEIKDVPLNTRGIYALLNYRPRLKLYDVVYVGMAGGIKAGIRGRLRKHSESKSKSELWTHFSIFEVWPNITENEIKELEGLFRQIYRKDKRANKLNKQRQFGLLKKVRENNISFWS